MLKRSDLISILVVTHNHKNNLYDLLSSFKFIPYKNVFFCEANSKDGTAEILRDSIFVKNVLFKNKLESFSKNNNDLIRYFHLDSKYYLLLNPDTFFTMDFLSPMIEILEENPDIAIAAPRVLYPDGTLQKTWKKFPSPYSVLKKRLGFATIKNEAYVSSDETEWTLGACMLIRGLMKKEDNLLDERYRLYCEDIDICTEAWHRKYKIKAVKDSTIYHSLQENSSKNLFSIYNLWNIQSIIKYIIKWNIKYIQIVKDLRKL